MALTCKQKHQHHGHKCLPCVISCESAVTTLLWSCRARAVILYCWVTSHCAFSKDAGTWGDVFSGQRDLVEDLLVYRKLFICFDDCFNNCALQRLQIMLRVYLSVDQFRRIADVAFSVKIAHLSIRPTILQTYAQCMPHPCQSHTHMRTAYTLLMQLHTMSPPTFHK